MTGVILLADRAYDADKLRTAVARKGAFGNILPIPQRVRRSAFGPFLYRYRNLIERFFSKPKPSPASPRAA
jgi:transposase